MFHFEHRTSPVIPLARFLRRQLRSGLVGAALILVSLAGGMLGYHRYEGLSMIDSFENAAMLLAGMGPLWQPQTDAGKLFVGCYALYCGLAVIVIAGVAFAPAIHRFFHVFHVDEGDNP